MATTVSQDEIQGTTLGYAQITANFSTASTTMVQVTGLTATVTVPAGGRRVKITAYAEAIYSSTASNTRMSIWDGTVGSGTQIGQFSQGGGASAVGGVCMAIATPSAGTKTYNVGFCVSGGTGQFEAASTLPAFILVELI